MIIARKSSHLSAGLGKTIYKLRSVHKSNNRRKFRDPHAEDKTSSTRVSPKYRIVPYGILVRTTQLLTQLTACQFNVLLVLTLHRRLVCKATYAYNL